MKLWKFLKGNVHFIDSRMLVHLFTAFPRMTTLVKGILYTSSNIPCISSLVCYVSAHCNIVNWVKSKTPRKIYLKLSKETIDPDLVSFFSYIEREYRSVIFEYKLLFQIFWETNFVIIFLLLSSMFNFW